MLRRLGKRTIRLVRGDITAVEAEAFVFDITSDCKLGSGYGGAIAQRGGKTVQAELDALGMLPTGEAAITSAGDLKARYIIHANGPKYHEADTEEKLRRATRSALTVARRKGIAKLALPPIGSGIYQVPIELCARLMVAEVVSHLRGETSLEEVTFVALDSREHGPLAQQIAQQAGEGG